MRKPTFCICENKDADQLRGNREADQRLCVCYIDSTDKQNALRRECTFKIEIVLKIGMADVNIYLKITILTLSDVLVRLAQLVRPWRQVIDFYQ